MNISMSNVGALPDITIRADGITVLYGPNDTGKSTVLKAIDSVLVHSDSDETYAHLVEKRIESTFDGMRQFRNIRSGDPAVISIDDLLTCVVDDDEIHVYGHPESVPHSVSLPLRHGTVPDLCVAPSDDLETLDLILGHEIPGRFLVTDAGMRYVYDDGRELGLRNVPTGVMVLGMLRMLVADGRIGGESLLLLDDPDAHLHPAWINILTNVLIALNQKVGVKIILTTHDPQLMMALETGATDIEGTMSFYRLYRTEEGCIGFSDVTCNLETAYDEMAKPIEIVASSFWKRRSHITRILDVPCPSEAGFKPNWMIHPIHE